MGLRLLPTLRTKVKTKKGESGMRSMAKTKAPILFGLTLLLSIWSKPVHAGGDILLSSGQTVYLPVYTYVYVEGKAMTFPVTPTLSLRNTDPANPITIVSAKYYGPDGKLVRDYLEKPIKLDPLNSVKYMVKETEFKESGGPCFLITWKADREVNTPMVTCITIGSRGQQGISFVSEGRPIRTSK
jgi:hypothetical protein